MSVGEICNREVIVTQRGTSAREAAHLMREHHVGSIVVVEGGPPPRPAGIVTDRDLVMEILAKGGDPSAVAVDQLMRPDLVTAREEEQTWAAIERMRAKGVRRMIVVNEADGLEGILTMDDLLEFLVEELSGLVKLVKREQGLEFQTRSG